MTAAAAPPVTTAPLEHPQAVGPIGRLGRWTAGHARVVAFAWVVVAVVLGPSRRVEHALSGAGWERPALSRCERAR